MSGLLKRFREDITGATAIEYALIASLISISIVTAATSIGTRLFDIFTAIGDGFPEADS